MSLGAGWRSPVARLAHNQQVAGSSPAPATILRRLSWALLLVLFVPACDDAGSVDGWASGLETVSAVPGLGALGGVALVLRKLSGPSRSADDVAALRAVVERQAEEIGELRVELRDLRGAALSAGFTALVRERRDP